MDPPELWKGHSPKFKWGEYMEPNRTESEKSEYYCPDPKPK